MLSFKAGDQGAFRSLFDNYKKRIINYCYRFCGHPEVAEELAQETFLKVYKAAPRYRPKARFSTWLFKIATNVCLNEIRKPIYRNRLQSMEDEQDGVHFATAETNRFRPDDMVASRQEQQMVRRAICRLPRKQRAALLLRIDGEFSYREIGKQINCSENHVKTLIHRGRQRLRETLAAHWERKK